MTSCYWYNDEKPEVGDVVMCTVSSYGDAGYSVSLDGYNDLEGFIPLCELSQKRIRKNPATFLKIGDRHPVQVMSIDKEAEPCIVELSLKDVNTAAQERCQRDAAFTVKLYNMCQRLEHVTHTAEAVWHKAFKTAVSKKRSGIELFEALHVLNSPLDLPEDLVSLIRTHHVQLFGFSPVTVHKNYLIQCFRSDGNQYVKTILSDICPEDQKIWSTDEISENHSRYNLSIKLIGLPKILVTVTAANGDVAEEVHHRVEDKLKAAHFNILMQT